MRIDARRCFLAGSIGLALGGVLHMGGQFRGGEPPFPRAAIEAAMRAYTIEGAGMSHSLMDVMQCWGAFFGVLALFGGIQNLLVAALLPGAAGLRTLSASSAACAGVLLGVAIYYHVPPPIVVFGVVFLCYAAAFALATRGNERTEGRGK